MPVLQISERDRAILEALGLRVRLFSFAQLCDGYFSGIDSATHRRLEQLSASRLLETQSVVARKLPDLEVPLVRWAPGDAKPNFGHVAANLRHRWSVRRTRTTKVVTLGKNGARLLGMPFRARLRQPLHVAHDLALAELFVLYRSRFPEIAGSWIGEDAFGICSRGFHVGGGAVPDALIVDSEYRPTRAIEIGGVYSERRIASLHRSLSKKELPYELW